VRTHAFRTSSWLPASPLNRVELVLVCLPRCCSLCWLCAASLTAVAPVLCTGQPGEQPACSARPLLTSKLVPVPIVVTMPVCSPLLMSPTSLACWHHDRQLSAWCFSFPARCWKGGARCGAALLLLAGGGGACHRQARGGGPQRVGGAAEHCILVKQAPGGGARACPRSIPC